jgi:ferric-dicitrate binding protein FerR (iron transport regulator)
MSTPSTTSTAGIRASDAEREHVARILRAATGTGLLSLAEVEQRLSACYAAQYRHELQPLTADLPDAGGPPTETPHGARRRLARHAALVAALAALLVVVWTASDAGFFWPVWPIAFLLFGLIRHSRRVRLGAPV